MGLLDKEDLKNVMLKLLELRRKLQKILESFLLKNQVLEPEENDESSPVENPDAEEAPEFEAKLIAEKLQKLLKK
jgi:hypothetical protein